MCNCAHVHCSAIKPFRSDARLTDIQFSKQALYPRDSLQLLTVLQLDSPLQCFYTFVLSGRRRERPVRWTHAGRAVHGGILEPPVPHMHEKCFRPLYIILRLIA